jgi:hypothetical protein
LTYAIRCRPTLVSESDRRSGMRLKREVATTLLATA